MTAESYIGTACHTLKSTFSEGEGKKQVRKNNGFAHGDTNSKWHNQDQNSHRLNPEASETNPRLLLPLYHLLCAT